MGDFRSFWHLGSHILRPFNHWEMEAVQASIGLTYNRKISPQKSDKHIWKGHTGCFIVKTYFRLLEGGSPHQPLSKSFGTRMFPQKSVFSRGSLVGLGSNFKSAKKRGYHLARKCPLCGREEE